MSNFDALVDLFIQRNELGHFSEERRSITLYDIPNKPKIIQQIKDEIDKITTNYCFVVLLPKLDYSNINILNIDL